MKNSISIIVFLVLLVSCVEPIPRRPVSHHSDSYMEKSVILNKKINAAEEAAIKKYIALDSLNTYLVSPDGFWYKYEHQINDEKPLPIRGDEIIFEYEILSLTDKILYSKKTLGKINYLVDKEDVTSGLQNGLKLMKEGEEAVFLFPSFKAFGFTGDQQKIRANQPLIYKVKLIKIKN